MKSFKSTLVLVGFALMAGPLTAGIDGLLLGTSAPPSSLGTFTVTPFTADVRPTNDFVDSVPVPALSTPSGSLLFDTSLIHWTVDPSMWATWSHGYTGDVYYYDTYTVPEVTLSFDDGGVVGIGTFKLNLTLPTGTKAFSLYVEPGPFAELNFDVQALGSGGAGKDFLAQTINGEAGAVGFGFFATDPGSTVNSIAITAYDVPESDGFAIGEFAIDGGGEGRVPDSGATALLLAFPLFALAILRKQLAR